MTLQEINEEPERRIRNWLEQINSFRAPVQITGIETIEKVDLNTQIREAAYYLSLKNPSYEDLCWSLAEKIQKKNISMPTIEDIRKKAEEISNSSKTYGELCWLNAEFDISIKKELL